MLVAIQGFGSIWERKTGQPAATGPAHVAYYNTTGVAVAGKVRYRWRIGGKIRFNAAGSFNPNCPSRSLARVFECEPPEPRPGGWRQMLFRYGLPRPTQPDLYLFVVEDREIGRMDITSEFWKAGSVQVLSFSENHDRQQGMFLMPAYSWIRGEAGAFFAEPSPQQPWRATLATGCAA